ncbi:MAG: serine/threonine-protein kinase [Niabella sp.]
MEDKYVNGYKLKYKLGEGGMAEVWYAENVLGKPAAVKVLQKRFSDVPDIVSRFENEARLMVQLNHRHIRSIYDYATIDGLPCMVMEYLEGRDLSQRMKGGEHFSNEQLSRWWDELVDALRYTHRKNIIHRDIKPSNLFVTESGQIKLVDFGIAKLRDNITITQTGSRMGTLMYMSPEQVYDVKNLSYKTDNYSLAVTFYHLATGKAPYDADKVSDFEIQENIVRKSLDTSLLVMPWQTLLPPYLAKDPERRPELHKITEPLPQADTTMIYAPEAVAAPVTKESSHVEEKPITPQLPAIPERQGSRFGYLLIPILVVATLVLLVLNKDRIVPLAKSFLKKDAKKEVVQTAPKRNKPIVQEKEEPVAIVPAPDTTVTTGEDGTVDEVTTSVDASAKEAEVRNIMRDYYRSRSDCNATYRFFKDVVKQYYNKSNIGVGDVLKECEQYHRKWKFIDAEIDDNSYVFTHHSDGSTYADFTMRYSIKKEEADDWIVYNIDVAVVLDANNRIERIVERRVEKL